MTGKRDPYFDVEALSASGAKQILKSPAHYRAWKDAPDAQTPAMVFGTVVHALILEPERDDLYVVKPAGLDRRTKDGKAAYEELLARGLPIIDDEDHYRALGVRDAVLKHPVARDLLAGARAEASLQWRGYGADVLCKAKLDAIGPAGIVDLKTSRDASPNSLSKTVASFQYHLQAAHYQYGVASDPGGPGVVPFTFIFVETEEPFGVSIARLSDDALERGLALMERAAELYAHCLKTGAWPAYEAVTHTVGLPGWSSGEAAEATARKA